MVKYNEMNFLSCEFKNIFINYLNNKYNINIKEKGIKASILIEEVYWNNKIETQLKQYIYYLIRTKHYKEFKSKDQLDLYGLGWDWFNTGNNIYDCFHIVRSNYITKSYNLKYCQWVNKCNDCDHLLFCNNLLSKSYYAFNQPVTPQRFRELTSLSLTELKKQPEFNASIYRMLRRIHKLLLKGESHNETNND